MILFPAIDLKDGACVRLVKGDMDQATIYAEDPGAQAASFADAGCEWVHVVDLNGAFAGRPVNAAAVDSILGAVKVPIQLGGGIRDRATIDFWLERGVSRVILGTAALRDPELVRAAAGAAPGRVAVGIDPPEPRRVRLHQRALHVADAGDGAAHPVDRRQLLPRARLQRLDLVGDGRVAVEGWAETSDMTILDLARKFEDAGVAAIIYTDIDRDGVLTGPNVEATAALARAIDIPVIASGGVSSLDDLRALMAVADSGITGVISGRAIYDGRITLAAALALLAGRAAG